MVKTVTVSDMPDSDVIESAAVLGQLIKAKRTYLGIKLVDCAALCGVGVNTLSRIENGNANCTLSAVFSVLNGLGIKLTAKSLMQASDALSDNPDWV